jgi:hypothetical protein
MFAIRYRFPEIRDEVPKKISKRLNFRFVFDEKLPPSPRLRRDKTAWQAQNGAKILVTNSDHPRFATVARDRGITSSKKAAAPELAGRRASNFYRLSASIL